VPRLVHLSGVALVLVAGAFFLPESLTWRPGVTAANVRRIKVGMTLAEVEALLGRKVEYFIPPPAASRPNSSQEVCVCDRGSATVWVVWPEGVSAPVVVDAVFQPKPGGPLNLLRRAVGAGSVEAAPQENR
jgi:hypothetical protein